LPKESGAAATIRLGLELELDGGRLLELDTEIEVSTPPRLVTMELSVFCAAIYRFAAPVPIR
jgi:hypothetical protein